MVIFMAQHPPVGLGPLIIEVSLSHSDTPHSVGLFWTSDQPDAETTHYLTRHTTHKRQTSMPPAGFEITIPANERPQTQALVRAAKLIIRLYKYLRMQFQPLDLGLGQDMGGL